MRLESDDAGRFVQIAPVNRTPGYEETDGVLVFLADADLRACEIDPTSTDYVGVRITPNGRIRLYEATHADGGILLSDECE